MLLGSAGGHWGLVGRLDGLGLDLGGKKKWRRGKRRMDKPQQRLNEENGIVRIMEWAKRTDKMGIWEWEDESFGFVSFTSRHFQFSKS
jgi:hypothetical protein